MRTARLLTVSPSMHYAGGVPAPRGGGVPAPGGGGGLVFINACTPPMNRMTDKCKNITLPQTSFAAGNYSRLWLTGTLTKGCILGNPNLYLWSVSCQFRHRWIIINLPLIWHRNTAQSGLDTGAVAINGVLLPKFKMDFNTDKMFVQIKLCFIALAWRTEGIPSRSN